jgi:predicted nucleic acid-binding protein
VRVYLDSNIVLYLIEQPPDFGPRATARIADLRNAGDELVVSDLTRLECRHFPLGRGDAVTLGHFDAFFGQSTVEVVTLTTAVCDRATEIRAHHRVRTPDALHLAAAIESGCQLFLTNDLRLAGFTGMAVEALP